MLLSMKIIDQYMLVLMEVHCTSSSTFLGQSMRFVVQHSQNLVPFTQSSPELRVPLSPEGEGLGSRMFATARYIAKKKEISNLCTAFLSRSSMRRTFSYLSSLCTPPFFLSKYGISLTVVLIVKILI